jgi:cell division protein FtsX
LYQTGRRKLVQWGMAAGGLAVLLALGLTYNAVRLKIDHQHEAVRLMSLLGATPAMLSGLYWVQGAILGGIGGLAGALLLSLLTTLVATRIATNLNLVEPSVMLCGLTGAVLGVLGGVLAVGRYLKI